MGSPLCWQSRYQIRNPPPMKGDSVDGNYIQTIALTSLDTFHQISKRPHVRLPSPSYSIMSRPYPPPPLPASRISASISSNAASCPSTSVTGRGGSLSIMIQWLSVHTAPPTSQAQAVALLVAMTQVAGARSLYIERKLVSRMETTLGRFASSSTNSDDHE